MDFFSKLLHTDRSHYAQQFLTYASYWKDSSNEGKGDQVNMERKTSYDVITRNFYDLVTDFYIYGWGQSFHFATQYPGEDYSVAIARHEHYLALRLKLQKGMKVVDLGCGVGGPLREITKFSGAHITGVNISPYQIKKAKEFSRRAGLEELNDYVIADFMKLPETMQNKFDAAYTIEATCHAQDPVKVYSEFFKILKPGAMLAGYEWAMTSDTYDSQNPVHVEIKKGIEEGNGIGNLVTTNEIVKALKKAGFEIIETTDLTMQSPLPFYHPLVSNFSLSGFTYTPIGRVITDTACKVLEKFHLAPEGTSYTSSILMKAADALVLGGKEKIFTPYFFILARKPE